MSDHESTPRPQEYPDESPPSRENREESGGKNGTTLIQSHFDRMARLAENLKAVERKCAECKCVRNSHRFEFALSSRCMKCDLDAFRDASGLVGPSGDPSDVTPEQLGEYVEALQRVAGRALDLCEAKTSDGEEAARDGLRAALAALPPEVA